MAGLMDLLFPYGSKQERAAEIKDQSTGGLLDAMRLDTRKYMTDPPYVYLPGTNPRAEGFTVQRRVPDDLPPDPAFYPSGSLEDVMPGDVAEKHVRLDQLSRIKDAGMMPKPFSEMTGPERIKLYRENPKRFMELRVLEDRERINKRNEQERLAAEEAKKKAEEERRVFQGNDPRSSDAYKEYAKPRVIDTPLPPEAIQPAQPAVDPQQQMIEAIKQQRAMLDQLYPQRSYENPKQAEADAYALDARERAAQMARLAFFAGITNAAGGNWTAVGQGLMAAGGAYDQGFQRYQQALQDIAGRSQTQSDQRYTDEVNRTNSAVNLYQEQQKMQLAREKLLQEQEEKRKREIMDRFELENKLMDGGDFMTPDELEERKKNLRRFQKTYETGTYISGSNDVRQ